MFLGQKIERKKYNKKKRNNEKLQLDDIKQNDDMDFDLLIKKLQYVIRKSGPFRKMKRGKAKDKQQKHGNDLIKSGADQQRNRWSINGRATKII